MKKFFYSAIISLCSLMVTSCENLHVDFLETQIQKYVTPENVALAITASFLHEHPEADITMLQVADELRDLADGGILDLDTAYAKVEDGLNKHDLDYKKEVLFVLDGLFDQYAYVFDTRQVDVSTYHDTLIQFADGIEEALAISNTRALLQGKKG